MSSVFEKIIKKQLPAKIIYEDDKVIAFNDINPKTNGHFLVVPKIFAQDLTDISDQELSYLIIKSRELALNQIKKLKVSGFNLLINSGKEAGQEVMHLHVHIIPSNH